MEHFPPPKNSKADAWLKKLTESESTQMFNNRHILAYVVGLGFGTMSGAFSLVNVLADSLGPGTLGKSPPDFAQSDPSNVFKTLKTKLYNDKPKTGY